ncbi:hypothetical protein PAPHI01_0500 [Pancytospora philotis]|nr:hypothetical protein PAPHI01_0500 [Pancytospora philotis]
MIECALYGLAKKKLDWRGSSYRRLERVFTRSGRRVLLYTRLSAEDGAAAASSDGTGFPDGARSRIYAAHAGLEQIPEQPDRMGADRSATGAAHFASSPQQCTGGAPSEHTIIQRQVPDKNKNTTTLNTSVFRTRPIGGCHPERLLLKLGYEVADTNLVEVHEYNRGVYKVELTRLVDDGSAAHTKKPQKMYDYYLIKVYAEVDDPRVGEQILNEASRELEDEIELSKPSTLIF